MEPRIGVFGGTFDPIHVGHLITVEEVLFQQGLDRILFVPNREPPHKSENHHSPATDRFRMVELAVKSKPEFEVDSTEINTPGPSYAIDTLRSLRGRLGEQTTLFFILGLDALLELDTWRDPDALLEEFEFVAMQRPLLEGEDSQARKAKWDGLLARFPGVRTRVQVVDVPQIEISSHAIRRRIAAGAPVTYWVLSEVEEYIRERGLYREP